MRRAMLSAAVAAAFLAASAVSVDADQEAIGAIVNIDPVGGTVTLDSGQTFLLSTEIDPTSLQVGNYVSVTYEPTTNGVNAATRITPLSRI